MNGTTSDCGQIIINGNSGNYESDQISSHDIIVQLPMITSRPSSSSSNTINNNNNNSVWQMAAVVDVDNGPLDTLNKPTNNTGNGTSSNQPMDLDGTDRISAVQNAVLTAISELERLQNGGVPTKTIVIQDPRYLELTKDKPVKLQVRILVPVKDHPKFNFVGKLLGPKGNSLKRLQEDTLTKMAILGRGSMRDKAKEDELRQLNDPKFAHLGEELHVEISTLAPPAEAYARISHAMTEIKRFLVPDYNDDIRQDQLRELAYINGNVVSPSPSGIPPQPSIPPSAHRRPGGPPPPPSLVAASVRTARVGLLATPSGRAMARSGVPPPGRTILRPVSATRATAYRTAVVPDARLRAEDGYVYDDGFVYPSTYDDGDTYYEFTSTGAGIDPYPEEFIADDDWRLSNDSSRLKAPRPNTSRTTFRDHPYAPQSAASTPSIAPATPRF